MIVVVIGLGSMGKRRVRLLKKYFPDFQVYGVESEEEKRLTCQSDYGIASYDDISQAFEQLSVNCVFICTPPLSHSKIITKCLENKVHVFTELNLVDDWYQANILLAKQNDKILFLSSTALYRQEMVYIINKVQQTKDAICYNYHVGQYLPDWHPWENYLNSFFSAVQTNGCREILAIEMPWIIKAFGKVVDMHVISKKVTNLTIDFDDYYNIQLIHENGHIGNLVIDVVSREAVRKLEIFGEDIYISWDGRPDSLYTKNLETAQMDLISLYDSIDKIEGYSSTIIENQYYDEMTCFFNVISGKEVQTYGFEEDLYTLRVIDRIEGKEE